MRTANNCNLRLKSLHRISNLRCEYGFHHRLRMPVRRSERTMAAAAVADTEVINFVKYKSKHEKND